MNKLPFACLTHIETEIGIVPVMATVDRRIMEIGIIEIGKIMIMINIIRIEEVSIEKGPMSAADKEQEATTEFEMSIAAAMESGMSRS
jgi:hypothetical protein